MNMESDKSHDAKLTFEAWYWMSYIIANGPEKWELQKSRLINIRGREAVLKLTDKIKELSEEKK